MRDEEARAWSPLLAGQRPGQLRIITRGESETAPLHDQAVALSALLEREAQRVELRAEPDTNHLTIVFDLADPAASLGRRLSVLVGSS